MNPPCPGCGNALDPARATYNTNGVLLCAACAAKSQIATGDARAAKGLTGAAIGVLCGGLASWTCLGMFGVLPLVTSLSGIAWLANVARDRTLRVRLGGSFVWCMLAACLGLSAALPALLIQVVGVLGAIFAPR